MLYVCTNKIRPLPPRKDNTASGRATPYFGTHFLGCDFSGRTLPTRSGSGQGSLTSCVSGPESMAHWADLVGIVYTAQSAVVSSPARQGSCAGVKGDLHACFESHPESYLSLLCQPI